MPLLVTSDERDEDAVLDVGTSERRSVEPFGEGEMPVSAVGRLEVELVRAGDG